MRFRAASSLWAVNPHPPVFSHFPSTGICSIGHIGSHINLCLLSTHTPPLSPFLFLFLLLCATQALEAKATPQLPLRFVPGASLQRGLGLVE